MKFHDPNLPLQPRHLLAWLSNRIRTLQFTFTSQVIVCLTVSFLFGNLFLYREASKRLFERQEDQFRLRTLYLGNSVLAWQKSIQDTMQLVASSAAVRSLEPAQLSASLQPLFQQTPLRRWKVWRADGRLLLSSTPIANTRLAELRNRKNPTFQRTLQGHASYGVNSVLSGARLDGCLEVAYPITGLGASFSAAAKPAGMLSFCLPFSKIGQDSGLIRVDQIQDASSASTSTQVKERLIEVNRGRYNGRIFFLVSPVGNLVFPTVSNPRFDHISMLPPRRIASSRWYPLVRASLIPAALDRVQTIAIDGHSYFLYAHRLSPEWIAVSVVDTNTVYQPLRKSLFQLMLMQAFTLLITSIAIYIVCRQLTRPLKAVVHTITDLSSLKIPREQQEPLSSSWILEVKQVSHAIHRLSFAMDSFGRYLPKEVVQSVLGSNQSARLGGDSRRLAVLFTDIKDFASYSEALEASELLGYLNDYLAALTDAILKVSGTIDKYIGDSIMAFWGAPAVVATPATLACEAALAIRDETMRINQKWAEEGLDVRFETRVGVNIGDAIVGNVGSEERFNYTVVGDSVNLASRLEGANKIYKTDVMVSGAVVDAVTGELGEARYAFRLLGRIKVKGKQEVSAVYQLLGRLDHFDDAFLHELDATNQAMARSLDGGDDGGRVL